MRNYSISDRIQSPEIRRPPSLLLTRVVLLASSIVSHPDVFEKWSYCRISILPGRTLSVLLCAIHSGDIWSLNSAPRVDCVRRAPWACPLVTRFRVERQSIRIWTLEMACVTLKRSLDFDPFGSPGRSPKRRRCVPLSVTPSTSSEQKVKPTPFQAVTPKVSAGGW